MISRKTVGSLLLMLLIATGVKIWVLGRTDACAAALAVDAKTRDVERVEVGGGVALVPCRIWILRQPPGVQGACLAGLAAGAVFLMSAGADLRRALSMR